MQQNASCRAAGQPAQGCTHASQAAGIAVYSWSNYTQGRTLGWCSTAGHRPVGIHRTHHTNENLLIMSPSCGTSSIFIAVTCCPSVTQPRPVTTDTIDSNGLLGQCSDMLLHTLNGPKSTRAAPSHPHQLSLLQVKRAMMIHMLGYTTGTAQQLQTALNTHRYSRKLSRSS